MIQEDCFRWNVNASLSFFNQALMLVSKILLLLEGSEYGKSGGKYDFVLVVPHWNL